MKKKRDLKKKKQARAFARLEKYRDHGGPITATNVSILQNLKEKQLLSKIAPFNNRTKQREEESEGSRREVSNGKILTSRAN